LVIGGLPVASAAPAEPELERLKLNPVPLAKSPSCHSVIPKLHIAPYQKYTKASCPPTQQLVMA